MQLGRLCADLRRHPVKAHTRHLFQDPLLTWFVLAPKSPRRTLKTCTAYRLYPRSTSAKNAHHSWQLFLTFDLFCMCLESSPFLSDEYQSQDIVHGIWEKPSSTDCDGPCRADTPKERSNDGWTHIIFGDLPFGDLPKKVKTSARRSNFNFPRAVEIDCQWRPHMLEVAFPSVNPQTWRFNFRAWIPRLVCLFTCVCVVCV